MSAQPPWKVFLSHTSELALFPRTRSYIDAARSAVTRAGHVIVDMCEFPAAPLPAADMCRAKVLSCDIYVGILGFKYGSTVRDAPDKSYTEFEFETANQAGLPRLMFLLDENAELPVYMVLDVAHGPRQMAFRERVRADALVIKMVSTADALETEIFSALLNVTPQHASPSIHDPNFGTMGASRSTVAELAGWLRSSGYLQDTVPEQFTGRVWLIDEIDQFFSRYSRGYVIVEADAGLGKTALAAWLVDTRGYPAHFSGLPDGHQTRVALRHLGAQLISEYGLDTLAADGVLTREAGEPAWFDRVLRETAARCAEARPDRPPILVVDGLDECESTTGRFPLGLPQALPDGVYVLVTCRTGTELPGLRQPHVVLRIRADDARNLDDVRHHLEALSAGPLADLLARDGVPRDRFVEQLTRRCSGMWIYQRHVLEELRLGTRTAAQLDELPIDLGTYYRDNLGDLRREAQTWDQLYLPLLSTLAIVAEPVTFSTLVGLAGIEPSGRARRFVEQQMRPFLTATGTEDVHFSIYHGSLREFLTGKWTPAGLANATSLGDELRSACLEAHSRAAEHFLGAWGGLDRGLPRLAEQPRMADIDNRYGPRHLVEHLVSAGRHADVHRLLALERVSTLNNRANTWFVTHNSVNTLDGYLRDVQIARRLGEEETDRQYGAGERPSGIAVELRYALIQATIATLSNKIPRELVARLVKTGRWQPDRAMAHLSQISDPKERALLVAAIASNLPESTRDLAVQLAVDATIRIVDGRQLIEAVEALAPLSRQADIEDLLARLSVYDQEHVQAPCLVALVSRGPQSALDELLEYSGNLQQLVAARVLAASFERQPTPGGPAELFASLVQVPDSPAKTAALGRLIPHLSGSERASAATAAILGTSGLQPTEQRKLLSPVAPYLSASVIEAARSLLREGELGSVNLAAELAVHLLPDSDARGYALANAPRPDGPPDRLRAEVAATLPLSAFEHALATAAGRPSEEIALVVRNLAPYLPEPLLPWALGAARSLAPGFDRVRALTALIHRLSGEVRQEVIEDALDDLVRIEFGWGGNDLIAALGVHLRPPQLARLLRESVEKALRSRGDRYNVPATLSALAPVLPPSLLDDALTIATTIDDRLAQGHTLAACVTFLEDPHRSTIAAEALDTALKVDQIDPRTVGLADVVATLPPDHRNNALQAFLTALANASPGYWTDTALERLARIGRRLSEDPFTRVFNVGSRRPDVLASLVKYAAAQLPPGLLGAAIGFINSISDEAERCRLTAKLIPSLVAVQSPDKVLDMVEDLPYDDIRAQCLAGTAAQLPADAVGRAVDIALRIGGGHQAHALTPLIPRLSGRARASAVSVALAAIIDADRRLPPTDREYVDLFVPGGQHPSMVPMPSDDPDTAGYLNGLVHHLTGDAELSDALGVARRLGAPGRRARALAAIASRQGHSLHALIPEVLGMIDQTNGVGPRLEALVPLADVAADLAIQSAHSIALNHTADNIRIDPLVDFMRAIAPVRPDALWRFAESPAHAITKHDAYVVGLTHAKRSTWNSTHNGFGPVRHCFDNLPRRETLSLLRAALELISIDGGPMTVADCTRAIKDVTIWWP